jgi:hypothetical protein
VNGQIIVVLGIAATVALSGRSPAVSEPPEWTLREELRLGNAPGAADDLSSVTRAVTGRDGSLYVLTRSGEIVTFDRAGRPTGRMLSWTDSVSRLEQREWAEEAMRRMREELPIQSGSFVMRSSPLPPSSLGWLGDTLWTVRNGSLRVTLLSAKGGVVGRIPYVTNSASGGIDLPLALLADRSLLRTITPRQGPDAPPSMPGPSRFGAYRMPIIPGPRLPEAEPPVQSFLVRTSLDGTVLQGLEIFIEDPHEFTVRNPYGELVRAPFPFAEEPLIAATPDGAEVVFVERYGADRPGVATYSIARFDVATGKRTASRHEYLPAAITPAAVDSILNGIIDGPTTKFGARFLEGFESPTAARAAIREALDVPAYHPPVTDIVVGADRTVWLRDRVTGSWLAHAANGRIAGRITLPAGSRLVHGDDVTLWAAADLPGGTPRAQTITRYRIVRQ